MPKKGLQYRSFPPSNLGFLRYQEIKNKENQLFVNYHVDQSVDQSVEQSVEQSVDQHNDQFVDEEIVTSINASNIMNKVILSVQVTTGRYQGIIKSRRCVELFTFYENKNMRNKLKMEVEDEVFIGIFAEELKNTITVVSTDEESVLMILNKIINRCIQLDRSKRPKIKSNQHIPKTLTTGNKFYALDDSETVEELKEELKEDPVIESNIDTENISDEVEKALLSMSNDEFNCFKHCVYSNPFEIKIDVDIINNKLKELDISNVILTIEDSKTEITVWTKEEQMRKVLIHVEKIIADSNKPRTFADLMRAELVSNVGKVTNFGYRWTKSKSP